MRVRGETAETPSEIRDAQNNERHACGWAREGEASLNSDLETLVSGEPASLAVDQPPGLSQRRGDGWSRSHHE